MTVESLMNTFTQYVSWLYSGRIWARWELQTIAVTALVLLLFFLIQRRKARSRKANTKQFQERSSIKGINLDSDKGVSQGFEGNVNSHRILSIQKNNGNQKRWKETTKKWKNYQKLIEQLQKETALYKQAEQRLEQQFAKLKAANEQLRQAVGINSELIQEPDLSRTQMIENLGPKHGRILNTSEVRVEDS